MVFLNRTNIFEELVKYQARQFSGGLQFNFLQSGPARYHSHILNFHKGFISHGERLHQTPESFFYRMGRYLGLKNMPPAIQLANKRARKKCSFQEYLDLFIKLQLFDLKDYEDFTYQSIILPLEQLLKYPGQIEMLELESFNKECFIQNIFDFSLLQIDFTLTIRQQEWQAFEPLITSLELIPYLLYPHQNTLIQNLEPYKLINGKRTLLEIANVLEQDPLDLAKNFYNSAIEGMISFKTSNQLNSEQLSSQDTQPELPVILVVDDSPTVQAALKMMLSDQYSVQAACNAFEALSILKKSKISLVILDVKMPDIDGIRFCKIIRKMCEFHHLPIIMLTAKESVLDRLKGLSAGANEYEIKPIHQERIVSLLKKYLIASS